jgi:hypothetical protein
VRRTLENSEPAGFANKAIDPVNSPHCTVVEVPATLGTRRFNCGTWPQFTSTSAPTNRSGTARNHFRHRQNALQHHHLAMHAKKASTAINAQARW